MHIMVRYISRYRLHLVFCASLPPANYALADMIPLFIVRDVYID